MRRACDYQLDLQKSGAMTSTDDINYEWIRGAFYTGELAAWRATGDSKYLDAALEWGNSKNYAPNPPDTRHADWQCCGQAYLELYLLKKEPRMLEGIKANVDAQMAAPKPGRIEWWWCDALYMEPPVLTRLYAATGDRRYLKFLNEMYWDTTALLYSREERLFYRDTNFFEARSRNGKKVFWSRGNGWVLAGIARVLQYLPADDPGRPRFETLLREMSTRLVEIQPADGLWRPSLLDPEEIPTGETSGTAFFCFGICWGINNGLLDHATFAPAVVRAWNALTSKVTPEGRLGYVQGYLQSVAGAPDVVRPDETREYAVGAFLLAGEEVLKLVASPSPRPT